MEFGFKSSKVSDGCNFSATDFYSLNGCTSTGVVFVIDVIIIMTILIIVNPAVIITYLVVDQRLYGNNNCLQRVSSLNV